MKVHMIKQRYIRQLIDHETQFWRLLYISPSSIASIRLHTIFWDLQLQGQRHTDALEEIRPPKLRPPKLGFIEQLINQAWIGTLLF